MKMNNSELTPKQEELKKRLEQIRTQRNAETAAGRNAQKQEPKRAKAQSRKSEHRPRNAPQQQHPQKKAVNAPAPLVQSKTEVESKREEIYREKMRKARSKKQVVSQRPKIKKKNSLVKQLSDSDSLADAIILSEVLSKPIALRKK